MNVTTGQSVRDRYQERVRYFSVEEGFNIK